MTSRRFPNPEKIFMYVVGGVMLAVLACILLGLIVQVLWNQTLGSMAGIPEISYWQALGLFLLAKLFFGFGASPQQRKGNRKSKRSPDTSSPALDDDAFKSYWEQEGRDAFEAYQASKGKK